jgi:hypothetical protein
MEFVYNEGGNMKNFLAVYTGTKDSENNKRWEAMDEAAQKKQAAAGMDAWGKWVEKYKNSIVEMGAPVGKTKLISRKGISDITNNIAAYTVVRAESYDEAAKMFLEHPHFMIFPGDAVEVMECLPIPKM